MPQDLKDPQNILSPKTLKIVITGGHHSSAMPVIEELKKYEKKNLVSLGITWIGHKHSLLNDKNTTLEYREITSLGIPFYELNAGKVYRNFNLKRLLKVPLGFIQAFFLLLKLKPTVILSFGGYLAVPIVVCGWLQGVPSLTHEQTIVSGYANKFIAKFVKKILISWPQSANYFDKDKIVETGIPLRTEIFTPKSNNFVSTNNLPTIYITTGKSGSHTINTIIGECLGEILGFCNVIHQTGDYSKTNDFEQLEQIYKKLKSFKNEASFKGIYFLRKFVLADEIGEAYSKANLVVGRAGAHTVAEILALRKIALLIPISWVSHNEQFENAKFAASCGLVQILEEKDLDSKTFVSTLKLMLLNISNFSANDKIDTLVNKNSAKLIVDEIISISNTN
ncbi:glycosyltransferase [candidate division WWE3 bacterium]|nr:glycosyltransferase [candidate division WWE3 bacterium]